MNKYITKEEYLFVKGIDLSIEIQDDDNISNKVDRFIREVTDWCWDYLISKYDNNELLNVDFDKLPEFRQVRFREGVIEQIEYVLNNGWLNKDSGVNRDSNIILDLSKVQLGLNSYLKFKFGAFCNIKTY